VEARVVSVRASCPDSTPVVAIVEVNIARALEVVGTSGTRLLDCLLPDDADAGIILRAILNDHTGTGAAAIARHVLRDELPEPCLPVLNVVLGGGLTLTTVEGVAQALGISRRTLDRRMRVPGASTPEDTVDLALGSFAVVEERITGNSIRFALSPSHRPTRGRTASRTSCGASSTSPLTRSESRIQT